jgi:cytochrome b6-f complex iron-sulfur subunit
VPDQTKPTASETEPETHVAHSRLGLRTGIPAVKKGTKERVPIDPMPEGMTPFEAPDLTSRRDVMWMAAGWGLFGVAAATQTAMLISYLFPRAPFEPAQVFKVGPLADFPPHSVSVAFKKAHQVWICNEVYNGKPIVYALRTVCTHLGCTPNWLEAEQKFKCPCHGSGFVKSGINIEGPAPRPLERYKVVMAEDGQILVDKNTKYQQEKGQWELDGAYLYYS